MLDVGQVVIGSWWPFLLGAAGTLAVVELIRSGKWMAIAGAAWAFSGAWLSVAVLCSVASQVSPSAFLPLRETAKVPPRETLALNTGLDLYWRRNHTLAELERGFAVDRLDVLSAATLAQHSILLLAQPRLLAPEELVALDEWVRRGGRAVVLADPLLIWPSDLPVGDRRRPPATSLLDPLLTHWGLRLEAAESSSLQRRFLGGARLLVVQGASQFTVKPSRFARCDRVKDGLTVACRIDRGQVRLVADADLLDERLWLSEDGRRTSDNMAVVIQWLHQPLASVTSWRTAPVWVRSAQDLKAGLRWALLVAFLWSAAGAVLLRALTARRDPRRQLR